MHARVLVTRRDKQTGRASSRACRRCWPSRGINISFMSVSVTADQDAVMALGLDQEPDQELLAQLPNTEGITEFAMFTEKL